MLQIVVTHSTQLEITGTDSTEALHLIDTKNLPVRPDVGDILEGYKVGTRLIAERFVSHHVRTHEMGSRFALRRDFEAFRDKYDGHGERLYTYPTGSAFTIKNFAQNDHYNIVFDRDKGNSAFYVVSEYTLNELITDEN